MIDISDVGKLMCLPIQELELVNPVQVSSFIISAAAEALIKAEGHNWVPVIVRQTEKYRYEVIANKFVFAVAKQANLERIWCVVTDSKPETVELVDVLSESKIPKINLSSASRELIMDGLQYLIERQTNPLKGIDLHIAANLIHEARRDRWKDLTPIIKLQCKITKAKLDILSDIFYLPEPIELPPPPSTINIKTASKEELVLRLKYLSENNIDDFEKIDFEVLAKVLFAEIKTKWKTLSPVAKLDFGLTKSQLKTLKMVFSV